MRSTTTALEMGLPPLKARFKADKTRRDVSTKRLTVLVAMGVLVASVVKTPKAAGSTKPAAQPTAENALAAEQEIGRALLANDADAVGRLLDLDWAVVNADGGLGDGIRDSFCAAIRTGAFTRNTYELDLPSARVRLYRDLAVVTVKLSTSGMFGGKPFDVKEVQTDVLKWEDGGWKSVLTHEVRVKEKK